MGERATHPSIKSLLKGDKKKKKKKKGKKKAILRGGKSWSNGWGRGALSFFVRKPERVGGKKKRG